MYELHACTNGERLNMVPMVCTSVVCMDSDRQNTSSIVDMVIPTWKAKRRHRKYEEKENNEATLAELEDRSFDISMLPHVQQCTCIYYSSYYRAALAIYIARMMATCISVYIRKMKV